MKNTAIGILLLATIGLGYMTALHYLKLDLGTPGKTATILRRDLVLPIIATGDVAPFLRVEIKAEASGEVIAILAKPGDRVKKGDVIIKLQRDEEERSVDRAKRDLASAQARLDVANLDLRLAKGPDLDAAKANVDQFHPQVRQAEYNLNWVQKLPDPNEKELLDEEARLQTLKAQLFGAEASFARAELAIPRAEHAVTQAKAAVDTADFNLKDAQKRLNKTDIVAPIDGILASIDTQIGEVIQGGKTTFTGGTPLAAVLDMSQMRVLAEVDETDLGAVRAISPPWAIPGRTNDVKLPTDLKAAAAKIEDLVQITVDSYPDVEFEGIILGINPEMTMDPGTGMESYLVDVAVINDVDRLLYPGMRAEVTFTSKSVRDVLVCPSSAIREGPNGQKGVLVPDPSAGVGEIKTRFVPCEFGLDNGSFLEVIKGLSEGDVVYTKAPISFGRNRKND